MKLRRARMLHDKAIRSITTNGCITIPSTLLWGDGRQRFRQAALNLGFKAYTDADLRRV